MSRDDAFEYEMDRSSRISDALAEAVIADARRGDGGPDPEATTAFVRALPAVVPVAPHAAREAAIIATLADTARMAGLESRSTAAPTTTVSPVQSAWRWGRLTLLGAVIALLPLLTVGLAFAGVDLPEPVDETFERVGIDLPNQAKDAAPERGIGGEGPGAEEGNAGTPAGDHGAGAKPPEDEASGPAGGPPGSQGQSGSQGNDEKGASGPQAPGPQGVPPGHGGVPPGQGGVPPGNLGVPPGGGSGGSTGPPPDTGPPPGTGPPVTPPGQGGVPPGQAKPK